MQEIALICLAAATIGSTLILGSLWYMASAGFVPGWLRRLQDGTHRSSDFI